MSRWLDLARSVSSPGANSADSAESPPSTPPIGTTGTNGTGESGETQRAPCTLYDLLWEASDHGVVLEVVTPEPGATPVLVVAGPHQEVERLGPIVRANEAILISALTPYRDGDPLEDPRTVRLTMPEDEPDGLALHVRPRDGGTPLVWVEPATGRRLPN